MSDYITYLYLLTPLHTGGSANEGNLMGIAREVHTEFPYMPASSVRGRIRAAMEQQFQDDSDTLKNVIQPFFGNKIENGQQPSEGNVWFSDATLLLFPIASLSHHIIWVTCPLWLERWSRWVGNGEAIQRLADTCRSRLSRSQEPAKVAVASFNDERIYLQTALLHPRDVDTTVSLQPILELLQSDLGGGGLLGQLGQRLLILNDEDCVSLVETGLQREVRVALKSDEKTVDGGSFRSEEAIPPETVLFVPWGTKAERSFRPTPSMDPEQLEAARANHEAKLANNRVARDRLVDTLQARLQFGGLEGLGRGWSMLKTHETSRDINVA